MHPLINTLTLVATILNPLLGILVIAKRKDKVSYSYFIFSVSVGIWALTNFIFWVSDKTDLMLKAQYATGGIIIITAIIWLLYLTKRRVALTKLLFLIISGICILIIPFINGLVIEGLFEKQENSYDFTGGPLFIPYSLILIFFIIYLLHILISTYKKSTGVNKTQYLYIIIGIISFSIIAVFYGLIYPHLNYHSAAPFDAQSSLIFVAFTAYAITRYRFMDIRIIIRKSLIYSILFAILIGLAAFGIILLSKYITSALNVTFILGATFISVALALLFYPAKKLIQKTINKIVFSKTPVYEDQIVLVKQTLQDGKEFKKLFAKMENILRTTLKTEEIFVAIKSHRENSLEEHYSRNLICPPISQDSPLIKYLTEKRTLLVREEIPYLIDENAGQEDILTQMEKFLSKAGAEIILPLFQDEKIIGLLLLGKKTNQESYSANDIGFLESFRKDFAYALSNTLLYESALARAKQSA